MPRIRAVSITVDSYLRRCPQCGQALFADYFNTRTLLTAISRLKLRLRIRRCHNEQCNRAHVAYRPEVEGHIADQHQQLDFYVMKGIHGDINRRRSLRNVQVSWAKSGVQVGRTAIANAYRAYSALPTRASQGVSALMNAFPKPEFVLLDVFNCCNVVWCIRDCISRKFLIIGARDIQNSLEEIRSALTVPVLGIFSSGDRLLRSTIAATFPDVCKHQYRLPSYADQGLPDEWAERYCFPTHFVSHSHSEAILLPGATVVPTGKSSREKWLDLV
jgi:hypothetical protein